MYVDHFLQHLQKNTSIMLFVFMTFQENVGSSSCGRRMKFSQNLLNAKHWFKRIPKLKSLISDNEVKYVSTTFKYFCAKDGIRREMITPHNPQQNSVVERKKKIMVGVVRAMLHDYGLPLHLWA